jgi:UDP-sugar transporter A1/2/3
VLLIRYTQQVEQTGKRYEPATLVAVTEVLKLIVCVGVVLWDEGGITRGIQNLKDNVFCMDCLKMAVPAALYTLQNNLLFTALANLEATLFQVTYQLKVLTTALLMVLILQVRLSRLKWVSLVVLFTGVVFTQLQGQKVSKVVTPFNLLTGLTAVVTCSFSSSFASVYFEKILKKGSPSSLWTRNIQLALFSFCFATGTVVWRTGTVEGFLTGYTEMTWVLVLVQALGGILVALVMKYADNIMKGFATSIAIVVSGIFSYMFLDFIPTVYFMLGASTVILAVMLYSCPDPPASSPKDSSAV